MRLREFFAGTRGISKLGALKFKRSLFKTEKRTPHIEMRKILDMIETRPLINSGLKQLTRFVLGNDLSIVSQDKRTSDFLNEWINKRPKLKTEIYNFIFMLISTGNAYFEPAYVKTANGSPLLDNVYSIPDPSRVYYNLDKKDDNEFWIYEVPPQIRTYKFDGEDKSPKFWKVNYIQSGYLYQGFVWGIPLKKSSLVHFKNSWSRDGIYGRGYLASVIDDNEIMTEILKNYSIIARYRALGKKIISIGDETNIADATDILKLEADLKSLQDEDHIIINKPFKTETLSYTGENDSMSNELDFLRRDMISGLIPNFLTPWADEVNRSTSNDIKVPFKLELEGIRKEIINFLNRFIIGELRKSYAWISEDASFSFGDLNLSSLENRTQFYKELYDSKIITFNEFRKSIGFETIEGGDTFKKDQTAFESFKESIETDKEDTKWKSRLVNKEIFKRSDTNNFKVIKKNNIGGKIIRLVRDKDNNYLVFNSLTLLKDFADDEREPAISYYENLKKKLIKQHEDFLEGETPEDKLSNDLFNNLKRAYAEILDQFFDEIENSKVKKESILKPNFLGKIDSIFKKFNDKISGFISDLISKSKDMVIEPREETGNDTTVTDDLLKQKLIDKAELLIKSKTADRIKTFNQKAVSDIKKILSDGIAAGKSTAQLKQELKDKYVNYKVKKAPQDWQIDRIVRTEINSNINLLKLIKWKEQGFKEYEWVTVGDEKVRPEHKARNHRVFKIDDALKGKTIYPGGSLNPNKVNINCRCRAILYS